MAAGLGFKTFNTGDVLTAADTNGYLMQGVWVFASAAARTSAVTSPQEGNVSFLKDTNSLEIYDGAAWVAYGSGDITGVTAGTGISGGGTAGTVTITNSMATAIDAKGDLIVGTGADTFSRLAVGGTNGHVLTVDSAEATGMKWAAAAAGGGGKVLQVVSATTTSQATITSTTYTDTNLTASITPTAATSKVLVIVSQSMSTAASNTYSAGEVKLLRGATDIWNGSQGYRTMYVTAANPHEFILYTNISYLDSPATTSSTTYKTQGRQYQSGMTIKFQHDSAISSITLLEIGA
jgi:hypothetical protein